MKFSREDGARRVLLGSAEGAKVTNPVFFECDVDSIQPYLLKDIVVDKTMFVHANQKLGLMLLILAEGTYGDGTPCFILGIEGKRYLRVPKQSKKLKLFLGSQG